MFITTETRLTIKTISLCPELACYENRTREFSGMTRRLKEFRSAARRCGVERISPRSWRVIDRKWKTITIVTFH
jgi:hypothetical protein